MAELTRSPGRAPESSTRATRWLAYALGATSLAILALDVPLVAWTVPDHLLGFVLGFGVNAVLALPFPLMGVLLAGFGASVRDEVDLARMTDSRLSAVEETMQPTRVGLWLTGPDVIIGAAERLGGKAER